MILYNINTDPVNQNIIDDDDDYNDVMPSNVMRGNYYNVDVSLGRFHSQYFHNKF